MDAVKSQLFCQLVEEELLELSYDFALAGLQYSLGTDSRGLELILSGYSDELPLLLETVLKAIASFKVDENRFNLLHDRVSRFFSFLPLIFL